MKPDDSLIAVIAAADPAPRGGALDSEYGALAQRVRARVLESGRPINDTNPNRRTGATQRHVLRGLGSAAVVAMSILVVVVIGAVVLAGHGPDTRPPAGHPPVSSIPTVGQVRTAMKRQPRIVQAVYGSDGEQWVQVVLDLPAKYQAIYANADNPAASGDPGLPKGRLTLVALDKQGFEYRWTAGGCYRRYNAPSLSALNVFGGDLPVALSARPELTPAGVVTYRGQEGAQIAVNGYTRLIQSVADPGLPAGGVPATRTTYSYPASVSELSPPHICS